MGQPLTTQWMGQHIGTIANSKRGAYVCLSANTVTSWHKGPQWDKNSLIIKVGLLLSPLDFITSLNCDISMAAQSKAMHHSQELRLWWTLKIQASVFQLARETGLPWCFLIVSEPDFHCEQQKLEHHWLHCLPCVSANPRSPLNNKFSRKTTVTLNPWPLLNLKRVQ